VNVERIHWPLHAQRRLQERGLNIAEVENVIRAPGQLIADTKHSGRWIAQRRVGTDRPTLIRVVYVDAGGGEIVVVSAYRTTQVARYWRTDQ